MFLIYFAMNFLTAIFVLYKLKYSMHLLNNINQILEFIDQNVHKYLWVSYSGSMTIFVLFCTFCRLVTLMTEVGDQIPIPDEIFKATKKSFTEFVAMTPFNVTVEVLDHHVVQLSLEKRTHGEDDARQPDPKKKSTKPKHTVLL